VRRPSMIREVANILAEGRQAEARSGPGQVQEY
jgi:hypothetical protein